MKRECIHPRKAIKIVREFIDDISNFTYEKEHTIIPKENKPFNEMTVDEIAESWRNAEEIIITEKRKCKIVNLTGTHRGSCAYPYDLEDERKYFRIGININEFCSISKGEQQFRSDFVSRCLKAKGFANITLTVLHELGHFETHFMDFGNYNRKKELIRLRTQCSIETINFAYFQLPDETAATNWAINWLDNAENRKKAKAFEKKFFGCFEKN
jgi:hypothetical protein